ncbi:MAG: hypothetical protein COX30_00800 [Candidatus Moranbacteria bacterium CG23_combo_of_CG06-09_8_20_14_all_39_10]|nr:MAG: hypothetical protein COX30_00800 [Candidatus Moranbacteria bacterium CG23_combo_of_CG06-09_8_20_14_all_39_10]
METFVALFSGLATLATGAVAILIYFHQKRDAKIQAARVLITEIRIAEERIDQIRDKIINTTTTDLPSVFPTANWKKYSHIFISDFDSDEIKLLNNFYDYGEIIEDFAKRNNNYFWITTEERARVTVQKIADYVDESFGKDNPDKEVTDKRDYISTGMDTYNQVYAPSKTLIGIKDYLSKIPKITTSSCGVKLKKIAK